MRGLTGARAYQASARHRSQREQDADVFRWASAALRASSSGADQARALADTRRLWTMVVDLARDPSNPLPAPLRGQLVSVGLAVAREVDGTAPDLAFLMEVNDGMAAGLGQ